MICELEASGRSGAPLGGLVAGGAAAGAGAGRAEAAGELAPVRSMGAGSGCPWQLVIPASRLHALATATSGRRGRHRGMDGERAGVERAGSPSIPLSSDGWPDQSTS